MRIARSKIGESGVEQVIVIDLIVILLHLPLNLATINPGNKVLHVAGNEHSRVLHKGRPHSNMPLLNKCGSLRQILGKLQPHHNNGESSPTNSTYGKARAGAKVSLHGDEAQIIGLCEEVFRAGEADGVVGGKLLEFGDEMLDLADNFCVLVVLFCVAEMVTTGNLYLA